MIFPCCDALISSLHFAKIKNTILAHGILRDCAVNKLMPRAVCFLSSFFNASPQTTYTSPHFINMLLLPAEQCSPFHQERFNPSREITLRSNKVCPAARRVQGGHCTPASCARSGELPPATEPYSKDWRQRSAFSTLRTHHQPTYFPNASKNNS